MVRFTVRKAALLGAVLAAVTSSARAGDGCCPPPCAPAAPQFRTVYVTQCVPETYQERRTVLVPQTQTQTYTAYRCECVPVVKQQVHTVYRRVPEMQTVVRQICVNVPSCEERTVMRPCWTTQTVTTMVTKCVDRGHYECREVYSHCAALRNRMHQHRHRHDCCPPPCPPPTKTVKVWVPCRVQIQCPVTCCKRVCVMQPVTVRVNVCRQEIRQVTCQVCTYRCVAEQRVCSYTCMTTRMVPYQATRCVTVCVPTEQLVTCCRMVTRTVACQVPCDTCNSCCITTCCAKKQHGHGNRGFRGGRHGSNCCH
jgi:hypothetical protein